MRSEITDLQCRCRADALFKRQTPLLNILRRRVRIKSRKAHSRLSEHRLPEVNFGSEERRRRREVVSLLRLREDIRDIVTLIAPGVHVNRREENAERRMQNHSQLRNIL